MRKCEETSGREFNEVISIITYIDVLGVSGSPAGAVDEEIS